MVPAQQELENKNRRLRARLADNQITHQQVSEQVKPAEAGVAKRREPTYQEIFDKIGAVVGLRGPKKFLVPTEVEGMRTTT
jgi:hypothetical protein